MPVKSAGEDCKLFDVFVPFDVLGRFSVEQPALMDMGISIRLLDRSVRESALIIIHEPRFVKGPKGERKMPSNEIRKAVEMNQPLYRKFAFLVLLNKYNLFEMVHDPMLVQPTVEELENVGNLICVSAHTQQRIFAKEVDYLVGPPYALVRFLPTFSTNNVLKASASFRPVETHQLFQQSSILLAKYQSMESATLSYRAILPGPVYFASGSAEKEASLSLTERMKRVDLAAMPLPKLNETNLAAAVLPDFALPDIQSATRSPVPSIHAVIEHGCF